MFMEIQTGSGGILSYLQDILGGILSSSTKKSGGDSVRGGFCPTLEPSGGMSNSCKDSHNGTHSYEPPRGKTNNVVSKQVRHKLACTSTEKS